MYCRASTKRDADTRKLYVQMALCWAALAAELETRLALSYMEPAPRDDHGGADERWSLAAHPRAGS